MKIYRFIGIQICLLISYSLANAAVFSDADLKDVLSKHHRVLIYSWSPLMPLSVDRIPVIAKVAEKLNAYLVYVSDPRVSEGVTSQNISTRPIAPKQLGRLGFTLHFPSATLFSDGKPLSPWVPGAHSFEVYMNLLQKTPSPIDREKEFSSLPLNPNLNANIIKKVKLPGVVIGMFKPFGLSSILSYTGDYGGLSFVRIFDYVTEASSVGAIVHDANNHDYGSDPYPTLDGKYFFLSQTKYGGLTNAFFQMSNVSQMSGKPQKLNPVYPTPRAPDIETDYSSLGTLVDSQTETVYRVFNGGDSSFWDLSEKKGENCGPVPCLRLIKSEKFCKNINLEALPMLSKNGTEGAYYNTAANETQIVRRDEKTGNCTVEERIPGKSGKVSFSPDSKLLAFTRDGDFASDNAYLFDRETKSLVKIASASDFNSQTINFPDFFSDGRIVFGVQKNWSAPSFTSTMIIEEVK
jgi:hypothetical protein